MTLTRETAWALLTEYTENENLRKHALAVEAAVRGYARLWGEDEEPWGVVALLHDFDYDRWPSLEDHPFRGAEILRERGYPEWAIRAIQSHAFASFGAARFSHASSRVIRQCRERCRDLGLRGLTPGVPMLREGVGIRLAADDVPENGKAFADDWD